MATLGEYVNDKLQHCTPSQTVLLTLATTLLAKTAYEVLRPGHVVARTRRACWRVLRAVAEPLVQYHIRAASRDIAMPRSSNEVVTRALPENGLPQHEVLRAVRAMHEELDVPYDEGGLSGTVYRGGVDYTSFINDVMALFQWSNPLHVNVFGATRKMEAEVVAMVVHMYKGDELPDACGTVTSGGTESILMAMRVYRAWARETRWGGAAARVSVVVPVTAHPAFDKAAEYFDMDLIKVAVDPVTRRVRVDEVARAIRYDTIALVGSAPNFPYGVVDDIAALAALAHERGIGMHVDCCLGGFVMPFIAATGRVAPIVDFRNAGVTSISCDTHKYGCGPKGTSTVLYRSRALRAYQFSCVTEWPGGMYCSPAVSGSKPGNVIAGAWAAMVHIGYDGYVRACDALLTTCEYMTRELATLPFVQILGSPTASVFAFASVQLDIFVLGDALEKRGWVLNRLQFPSGLQFSVTWLQTQPGVAQRFVRDVRELGEALYRDEQQHRARGGKPRTGNDSASIYGRSQRVSDRSIVRDIQREFLNVYYTA